VGEPERTEAGAGLMEYSPENLMPFGPVHPALKEPEYFRLYLEGERIVEVIPRIGYVHRGLEKAAEARTWVKNLYLFERTCGICSFAHSLAYSQAVEGLTHFVVPRRARYIRLVVAELERIHSHMLWLGLVGYWTGFDTLFMWIWRDRERVLDLVEAIAGNRIHKSLATFTGVKRDIPDGLKEAILEGMRFLRDRANFYRQLIETEATILTRTRGVGRLSQETAMRLCAVGPLLRSTGVSRDVRAEDPYAAYDEVPPSVITRPQSDIHALLTLRLDEVLESIRLIEEATDGLPPGPLKVSMPRAPPKGESIAHIEAPRGELFYYVRSVGTTTPDRVKVRTPTLANLPTALEMLKGHTLADVPVVLTGMDPCFGCMDRMTIVDQNRQVQWSWTGEQLRQFGIDSYRRTGH
jgi:NADH-quinone oxidoreductase subunit D